MNIFLYDNWERSLRQFTPMRQDWVGLYCCGPTVYDYAHIGNLRTYLFEDILRRTLEFNGHSVRHVMNITDVGHLLSDADEGEDKMERQSRRRGESAWVIAQRYTQAFMEDLGQLNIEPPVIWCKATEHIPEQIAFVQTLEEKGYTYITGDGVYFDTSKQDDYGYLARLDKEGLAAGARVALGEKRNITDFALWKFSPPGEVRQMEWDSPWGVGFPGWHIECSAMASKYLEPWFDIHCGGEDHLAVHHTNEIAQNKACHGTRLANFWMHGYFLQLDQEKMSKSSGEFLRLQYLIDRGIDPLAYRYLCLTAHYRGHLNFAWEPLQAAQTALERLRKHFHAWPPGGTADPEYIARFTELINQDLNTPRALALVWELVKSGVPDGDKKATLAVLDKVLGLRLSEWQPASQDAIPADILELVSRREQCRADKNWSESDRLRKEIEARGFAIADRPEGAQVSRS
ncbi:cysteine--tRNA ligase [Massilia sp. erpn]|uniref:cysteine--tRNA ligase n=1 Tax=Massilia sp. erpn TaxID=2738142 RepID=UPI002103D72B|nr:cysteine--tRNA ligase [Massilia sp. erpn]UTY57077.1 cysteine--tRNA ligase [Massilia sp. erpn]